MGIFDSSSYDIHLMLLLFKQGASGRNYFSPRSVQWGPVLSRMRATGNSGRNWLSPRAWSPASTQSLMMKELRAAVETASVPGLFNEVQSSAGSVEPATAVETVLVPELGRLLQRNAPAVETVQSPICTMGSSPQSKWAIDYSGRNCLVPELGCIRKNTGSCHCKNTNAKEIQ
ncbi:hypothetical protein DdX_00096 [Ditylenchus destructor]|uniref:Uncharacterized protein n=1 Tax=Ditylenchus destructor TaxID=166010 RepID=A0AAD4RA30_9BILA|nr:hypothetical protein DdX_00096 [Ditylenchus destructor]